MTFLLNSQAQGVFSKNE